MFFDSLLFSLQKMFEKFRRNPSIPASKDIAERTFILKQRKIMITFHYAKGALTASTREFLKPPKPNYGEELIFDPSLTKGYKVCKLTDCFSMKKYQGNCKLFKGQYK